MAGCSPGCRSCPCAESDHGVTTIDIIISENPNVWQTHLQAAGYRRLARTIGMQGGGDTVFLRAGFQLEGELRGMGIKYADDFPIPGATAKCKLVSQSV